MKIKSIRMLTYTTLFAAAVVGLCIAAESPQDARWEPLFNGNDLTGWAPVNEVTFVVTNGNLRLVKGMGWLRTEKQYTDFIFEAEWRALVPQYDSGFFVRAGGGCPPGGRSVWESHGRARRL